MQVILYTYLILNVFIRYCAAQDDPAPDPAPPEQAPEEIPPDNNEVQADINEAENTAGGDGEGQKQNSNEFKRYIIEDNYRNPIFGSYKYDPIKQQFETTPESETTGSDAQSTKAGEDTATASPGAAPPAGEGAETPPPEGEAPPGSDTPPEAKRLRDRLKSMPKVPLSHWWARARPLPDLKSQNSSLGNTI